MALAFDATSSASGGGTGPFTFSHTCSGSERVLIGVISLFDNLDSVTGFTYNGVAFTAVPSGSATINNYSVTLYYLIAPATGSNTVSVTTTGAVNDIGIGVISFTGADQTSPLGTANTATGTSTTPSVIVSSAADQIVVDGLTIVHSGTLSVGASQTQRWNIIGGYGYLKSGGSTETGAASTTMSWSNSTSQDWALAAVPVKPVSTAINSHLGTLLGIGG